MKILKRSLLCLEFLVLVVSIGFGMWVFISIEEEHPQFSGGITVAPEEITGVLTVELDDPTVSGYREYSISINYGKDSADRTNLYKDVQFAPIVGFTVSDIPDETEVYYYFTFNTSSPFFNYVEFDLSTEGQNVSNMKELSVLSNSATESFQPIFRYKTGQKPQNVEQYETLLGLLSTASGTLTLCVIAE